MHQTGRPDDSESVSVPQASNGSAAESNYFLLFLGFPSDTRVRRAISHFDFRMRFFSSINNVIIIDEKRWRCADRVAVQSTSDTAAVAEDRSRKTT